MKTLKNCQQNKPDGEQDNTESKKKQKKNSDNLRGHNKDIKKDRGNIKPIEFFRKNRISTKKN